MARAHVHVSPSLRDFKVQPEAKKPSRAKAFVVLGYRVSREVVAVALIATGWLVVLGTAHRVFDAAFPDAQAQTATQCTKPEGR